MAGYVCVMSLTHVLCILVLRANAKGPERSCLQLAHELFTACLWGV